MGILAKKEPIKLEDFCEHFYNRHIFGTDQIKEGLDHVEIMHETYREQIIEAAPGFKKTNPRLFKSLIVLLRIETFALAWLHKFGIDSAIKQSIFTQKYLHKTGRDEVWDAGASFNDAVTRSTTAGYSPDTSRGRAVIGTLTKLRFDTAKQVLEKFKSAGIDPKKLTGRESQSLGRPINRLGSEKSWRKDITPGFLMLQVAERMHYELNDEARFWLTAMIHGFYNGASEAIENIKLTS